MFERGGYRLGIDLGTSNTVAVLGHPGGRLAVLLFDGSPTLPSAVSLDSSGQFRTGGDALHGGRVDPTGFEPNPKRLVDEGTVLLGHAEVPVAALLAAVLSRVGTEARRVAGAPIGELTLTYPASWAAPRRGVLTEAAARAGLPGAQLVPEPVAAARYFLGTGRAQLPVGAVAVVYDLGGGTFDATVVRRTASGFDVLATEGLDRAGGLDIDAAVVDYLASVYGPQAGPAWQGVLRPADASQRRANRQLWEDVRAAKETLSRNSTTSIHLPVIERDAPLGREQLEQLARPILAATVTSTRAAISAAGVPGVSAVFLVGGGSRVPLAATLLGQALGVTPLALEQPELVVAQGALVTLPPTAPRSAAGRPCGHPPPRSPHPGSSARPGHRGRWRPCQCPGFRDRCPRHHARSPPYPHQPGRHRRSPPSRRSARWRRERRRPPRAASGCRVG